MTNDTLDQSLGYDEGRDWEYDQLGNVTLKFTYDASAGDPNYAGPSATKYLSTSPSTSDGSWSVSVETPEVGSVNVNWEIDQDVYFDRSDSLGNPTEYRTERVLYSVVGASAGMVTVNAGETLKVPDFIYED